jgi:multidrug efflux pump subunit AcrA (membrane-fusion protein)
LAGVLEAQSRRRAAPGAFWRRAFRTNPARAATAAVAVALAAMFLPLQHRPKFEAEIEPQLRRYVAVPFDAVLRECRVQPGDVVHRGQVLATLEGRELRWRRDALQADYDRAVKRRDAAQATRAFAKLQLARLEIERLRVELELIDHQLSQLQLTSPVDGMILSGDLTRTEGAPLDKGQTLLEVAPVAELIVEVAIPDARINWVRPDARAELRLDATGQRCWSTRISRIHPRSELRDEQNVFIAECALPAEPSPSGAGPLRPGMKGRVRVDCGARPLGWILFHRPLESLRSLWW